MVEPTHADPEVPEADEIEQRTPLTDPDPDEAEVVPDTQPEIPLEAPEADVLEQATAVEPEEDYPPS